MVTHDVELAAQSEIMLKMRDGRTEVIRRSDVESVARG
jgi:predicted ABC-type transport system involved in lysophospholipase L1 biosynthesis ATPase subunit